MQALGSCNGFSPPMYSQLPIDTAHLGFDRIERNDQGLRHLCIGLPSAKPLQHLQLLPGECVASCLSDWWSMCPSQGVIDQRGAASASTLLFLWLKCRQQARNVGAEKSKRARLALFEQPGQRLFHRLTQIEIDADVLLGQGECEEANRNVLCFLSLSCLMQSHHRHCHPFERCWEISWPIKVLAPARKLLNGQGIVLSGQQDPHSHQHLLFSHRA